MGRLVVVSNRIAPPDNKGGAGGLAVGVLGALKAAGGLWFGWSGETGNEDKPLKKVTRGILLPVFECGLMACLPLSTRSGAVPAPRVGRVFTGECAAGG